MKCQSDGKLMGFTQCNKCGCTEAYHPTDITAEQVDKEGKQTIMRIKEHFEAQKAEALLYLRYWPHLGERKSRL